MCDALTVAFVPHVRSAHQFLANHIDTMVQVVLYLVLLERWIVSVVIEVEGLSDQVLKGNIRTFFVVAVHRNMTYETM